MDVVKPIKEAVGIPLSIIVGLTWMTSFLTGAFTHDYTALGITTPVMLVVTGAVLATRSNGDGNGRRQL